MSQDILKPSFDSKQENQYGGIAVKTKYYEFNRNGGSEKYSEITEKEYLKAKREENRWFISFGSSVLECDKSQYEAHFSAKNHKEYIQKDKNWRKLLPVSLDQYTYNGAYEQSVFKDNTAVEDIVLERLSLEHDLAKLKKAMKKLKPYEREIIYQLFWLNKNQKALADECGKSQQSISKIAKRILCKMLKLIENEK